MPQVVMPAPLDPFKLSQPERMSGVWRRLEEKINKMLEEARVRNDDTLDQLETQKIRGKIAAYKEILGFAKDDQAITWGGDDFDTSGIVQGRARR